MALPKLLQKLFQNGGVGPFLRPDIMPLQTVDGYAPDASGNVDTQRLPLSGGTMTGALKTASHIYKDRDDATLNVYGGAGYGKGAELVLNGKDASVNAGLAALIASDGSTTTALNCYPDGQLKWNTKEVERVNSSGGNWIRYESGLQICWVRPQIPSGQKNLTVTLPVAFADASAYNVVGVYGDGTDNTSGMGVGVFITGTTSVVISTGLNGSYDWNRVCYLLCIGKWK